LLGPLDRFRSQDWTTVHRVSPVKFEDRYVCPTGIDSLIGDAANRPGKLDEKHTLSASGLAALMVENDTESDAKSSHVVGVPRLLSQSLLVNPSKIVGLTIGVLCCLNKPSPIE
jgi:hypothetical protein